MAWTGIKRRVFISHFRGDRKEVDDFINHFANNLGIFTPYVLGANDNDEFIDSTDTDYVMKRIREKYLSDSTVTIVLMGSCTHSRRYVDWEIKSSLRQGEYIPNGLIGIVLPSQNNSAYLPSRFERNWKSGHNECYARYWSYPTSGNQLGEWIDDAFNSRTSRKHLIDNPQEMMKYNSSCKTHNTTH
ncbi:MTH538 TIR-like domain [Lutibacter agarilyticus]|uniref:MTH538 TIR-like domain n=1 Tax=Lutibacter agarilyticus TaxID=1109740 RepID=A0A238XNU5_9FLAO|nr:TIR domain-containing protein [Lutibacter agarilyticus]SNR60617.1 MTH538 TIR-like domain [Lutibacter agarilyticus]